MLENLCAKCWLKKNYHNIAVIKFINLADIADNFFLYWKRAEYLFSVCHSDSLMSHLNHLLRVAQLLKQIDHLTSKTNKLLLLF